mgnify:CR=1 FL=1
MDRTSVTNSRSFTVTAPDGVRISVQERGNPDGPEIVFLHGLMQCSLAWKKQLASPLAREFRMIAYDIRGHGASENRLEREQIAYRAGEPYAGELRAVLEAAGCKRPVLVGWSFGTSVICDYVRRYGTEGIAGINFVGNVLFVGRRFHWMGEKFSYASMAMSEELETSFSGVQKFVRSLFAQEPPREDLETVLCYNAMVPIGIRPWFLHPSDYEETAKALRLPVLVTHGAQDEISLPGMAEHAARVIPGARLSLYPGAGHSVFYEESERFNRELADFVRTCRG